MSQSQTSTPIDSETKSGDERRRFPMSMWNGCAQALAFRPATVLARHVRRRPGLVDEDEFLGVEIELVLEPVFAPLQDVGTILLARVRGLFFHVTPWRSKKRHSEPMLKRWPRSASCA